MPLIGVAGLSLKEKNVKYSRGHNFDPIITKLGTNVGLIKLHIEFGDEICGANRIGRTFLERIFCHP